MPEELTVHTARLFDGDAWHEDVSLVGDELVREIRPGRRRDAVSVPLVVPGLVDSGVRPEGYVEGPVTGSTVRTPEEAFVSLCTAYGVTSMVDVGSSWETGWWFRRHAGINYLAGGPRLCHRAASRSDVAVAPEEVGDIVQWMLDAGAAFVSVERDAVSALDDSVPRVVSRDRAGAILPGLVVERAGATWLAPQLLAIRLWSVDGLMDRGDCTEARAFLPYLGHFTGEKNFMARRAARHVLERLYGSRPALDGSDESTGAPRGRPVDDRQMLASSSAGSPGVVPGRSLWEEMELLEEAYGPEGALRAATGNAARAFPELNAGKLAPGRRFDAVLCEVSTPSMPSTSEVRQSMKEVVVAGVRRPVGDVLEEVHRQGREADGRKL